MQPARDPSETHPSCPRCGYDQSGVAQAWTESCPLEGTCPECGLGFAWSLVLDPEQADVPWSAEHARGTVSFLRRLPGTLLRLALPNIFWKRMPIEAPVRTDRAARRVLWIVIVIHLLASIPIALAHWSLLSRSYNGSIRDFYTQEGWAGLAGLVLNPVGMPFFEHSIMNNEFIIDLVLYKARFGPPSQWSSNYIGSSLYSSDQIILPLVMSLGIPLVWTTVLLAVPVTRARAKLRSAHIARAFVINALVVLLAAQAIRGSMAFMFRTNPGVVEIVVLSVLVLGTPLWSLYFWIAAFIWGWRVRGAWVLLVLGTVAAILGSVTATFLIVSVSL